MPYLRPQVWSRDQGTLNVLGPQLGPCPPSRTEPKGVAKAGSGSAQAGPQHPQAPVLGPFWGVGESS